MGFGYRLYPPYALTLALRGAADVTSRKQAMHNPRPLERRVAMKVRITSLGGMLSVACRVALSSLWVSMRIDIDVGRRTRKEWHLLFAFRS